MLLSAELSPPPRPQGNVEKIRNWPDDGAVNTTGQGLWAPLHFAAREGKPEASPLATASPATPSHSQHGPSHAPVPANPATRHQVVNALLDAKADPTLRTSKGEQPLHCAAEKGHVEVVELLLRTPGVDVNAPGASHCPLYWQLHCRRLNTRAVRTQGRTRPLRCTS